MNMRVTLNCAKHAFLRLINVVSNISCRLDFWGQSPTRNNEEKQAILNDLTLV